MVYGSGGSIGLHSSPFGISRATDRSLGYEPAMILSQAEDMKNGGISQSKRPENIECFLKSSGEEPVKNLSQWDIQAKKTSWAQIPFDT
jgi:hypothetical protein